MLRSLMVGVVAVTSASPALAQLSHSRRGVWLGVGAGAGAGKATCSICAVVRETGPAVQLRVGGTLSSVVLASVEGAAWRKNGTVVDRSFVMITAAGTVYPVRDRGLYLKAGLGGYWYVEEDPITELTSQGLALQLGAGYDIPITRHVGLAPFAALITSGSGNPTRLDKPSGFKQPLFSDLSVTVWQFGLGVTLY